MRLTILIIFLLLTTMSWSQKALTLEECYQLVNENYPLTKQTAMLNSQQEFERSSINAKKLPQVGLSAQGTYQSDVIEIPITGNTVESLNKEQYRANLTVNQLIYGGGLNIKSDLNNAKYNTGRKQIEVDLYQLKSQINQFYFSILLMQEKHQLLLLKQEQLTTKLKEVKSGIANGTLLPTSDRTIEVELLKIEQDIESTLKEKASLISSLSSIIGIVLDENTVFETPMVNTSMTSEIERPELELFNLKKKEIEASTSLLAIENAPKLSGFVDGGLGNPGLNMLDNSFQGFYTVGLKLKWNVFDWNSNKKERRALKINEDILDNETEVFKLNTNIELDQHESDIKKLMELLVKDSEIIALRREVLSATESQLRNGVITTSIYITELTNLYEEENRLVTHTIQLELAKSNYNIIKGN
ncbi:TolC family protein [Maribacter polysaccharolyticus]|uniref:TolC family protein n=1 Tax=Maribacter polysaccharolyticus TaxID=3020831 RepID=UPI00237F3678|nr:TolC family protein [Maribacter polysaccharolyticus]MDE3741138.1 TolC family protein [Maribacter polysaccharolyticus]